MAVFVRVNPVLAHQHSAFLCLKEFNAHIDKLYAEFFCKFQKMCVVDFMVVVKCGGVVLGEFKDLGFAVIFLNMFVPKILNQC